MEVEGSDSVVTRLREFDFQDVAILHQHGILARGEFLEVVLNLLGVLGVFLDAEVVTTATATATMTFADVEGLDIF